MMAGYRAQAERPGAPNEVHDLEAGAKLRRRRTARDGALFVLAAAWLPLTALLLGDHARATAYAIIEVALVAIAIPYGIVRRRLEQRSFFRQKLARETEEFCRAYEGERIRTRVFLRPMSGDAPAPEAHVETSEDADARSARSHVGRG